MLQKLKNLIENGDKIEFSVFGKTYIIPPPEGFAAIGLEYEDDSVFPDADSMMSQYIIAGRPLGKWFFVAAGPPYGNNCGSCAGWYNSDEPRAFDRHFRREAGVNV